MTEAEFAKTHLREHLGSLIIPPIAEGFWSIQQSAQDLCDRNRTPDQVIRTLQNMLTKIPEWSDPTLSTEVERIQKVTKCSYLDDLMMGVFIAYMKAFASLHQGSTELEIEFDRPTISKFIHELYVQSARKLWQVAYLFKTNVPSETQARARHEIEVIINQCLELVIRGFLPWDSITKKYFSSPTDLKVVEKEEKRSVSFGEDESESEEEEEEPPKLSISEEDADLGLDEKEVDPMKEIELKVSESLVLNL
jgi:hypothetical protein